MRNLKDEEMKYLTPDITTVTNAQGGQQSYLPTRCDLLPPLACLDIAETLHNGAIKYGDNNWRLINLESHLNHAMTHVFAYLSGNTEDDHLNHAATRLLFALELSLVNASQSQLQETSTHAEQDTEPTSKDENDSYPRLANITS